MRRALALLWLLCLCLATPVTAQTIMERLVTPGPLANSHAKLESNCEACHSSFRKEAQNGKCLSCHKGVASDVASGTKFHGRFGPARSSSCKSCHSDHKGRNNGLIALNPSTFNHALTDFTLTGAHQRVKCAGCHRGNDFRGRPKDCGSCHAATDPHKGQLGRACQTCHTTAAWKPVQGFNHASTGFPLTGAHAGKACMSCHAGQRWKNLPATCNSCHAKDDAHGGSRGTNCASCHTTASWRAATFDHATTGFPLIGGHAAATCAGCHGAGNANRNPSRGCYACHASNDSHKGANGTDCASCHTPRGWRQISFDHDRMTSFSLKGAHRTASCQACHKQPPKVAKPPATCFGCHAADDIHKGSNGQDCARCHQVTAWKAVDFNHNTMTAFPLAGKHAEAKCEACHARPAREVKLSGQCSACHAKQDPHAGKLGGDCGRCHTAAAWTGSVKFDHDLTRFPLLGKHAALACTACHADKSYAAKGNTCAACHADKHHAGTLGTPAQCQNCHSTSDWTAWRFDHDRQTGFALTGKHKGLVCSACHARPGNPAQQGTQCIDCHRRHDPHRGGFGEDCERCHTTSGFSEIIVGARRIKS
ncbi:cytochrome c3 family protein [Novosphingobium ginsenosidimutans]|uniref:Cytochrome C n=1 Tax=Novosphingobium ginsenosidimutans TaxID=1176536 RepID=A0A5B8S367_9SPHN|nr:cytochrome c3 family protein [Novosphingobium ginsenosidimutans]QEA15187.1 cytochrome C [Novosphingobium ginsenosidimutans]